MADISISTLNNSYIVATVPLSPPQMILNKMAMDDTSFLNINCPGHLKFRK